MTAMSANQRPIWCVMSRRVNQWMGVCCKVKSGLSCNLNYWSEKVTQCQLVFEEDIKDSCGEQILTGWSSGSSNSWETGFKEKPAGVLQMDLRRAAKLRYQQRKVYITDRLVDDRVRWSWTSFSTSLRNWHFNQPKNSIPPSSETHLYCC